MENLIFSLNATVPIFLMMLLGLFFRKIGWLNVEFANQMNRFVFLVPLPLLVFKDLATVNFQDVFQLKFVAFCFFVTIASITVVTLISFLWKDRSIQGEFIQASYRSSAALLGLAFIQNIYGNAGMASMMIIGSVPLYNIMAVIVLSIFAPERKKIDAALIRKTLKGIITNPIILGICAGIIWSLLRIPFTGIISKTVGNLANVASPMGLMAMGATFDFEKAFHKIKPALTAAFIKLVGFASIFLPLAIRMGFREKELVAILVMLSSATTVSCFVMARNMGHEGTLTSSTVMLTTMLSAFTLTGWLFLLKYLQLV
ncbi:MAG: AEC family transporter [Eubacteriales bacterium]|nr:AEC family transporter [Eubacteriales bacterium]